MKLLQTLKVRNWGLQAAIQAPHKFLVHQRLVVGNLVALGWAFSRVLTPSLSQSRGEESTQLRATYMDDISREICITMRRMSFANCLTKSSRTLPIASFLCVICFLDHPGPLQDSWLISIAASRPNNCEPAAKQHIRTPKYQIKYIRAAQSNT